MADKLDQVLDLLRDDKDLGRNVTHWEWLPPQPGEYAGFPPELSPGLVAALRQRGLERLYIHQAQAVRTALAGKHFVVVTPTASGKTLCYNLPVLQTVLVEPRARALYLFPTKALSQDQVLELRGLAQATGQEVKIHTFDGDTPANARKAIRTSGQIVVTNPDMLHKGILPHHTNWIKLFENLRYVVIDEVHHYRGVFGSHLAGVLRRLARICKFYGVNPVYLCCSATIANPKALTEQLISQPVELIDRNGAPRGGRHIVFYNPPVVNPELGIRRSVVKEAARIAARLIYNDVQTITFTRSRIQVEVLTTYLKRIMRRLKRDPERIKGYRGGYLPLERRAIEAGVKSGEIQGVVSTNALELGIDIGQLQAAVLTGYPGSVASTWQQGGRAGRRAETSLVVVVYSSAPMDQYLAHQPAYFFGASCESGIINPDNPLILSAHVKCGAFEAPFKDGETFGPTDITPLLQYLEAEQLLHHRRDKWHYTAQTYPAEEVSLRSASPENFVILNTAENNTVIGEVDFPSAPELVHEEAIYLHQTVPYIIDRLDWDGRKAYARPAKVDYYTDAVTRRDLRVLAEDFAELLPVPPPSAEPPEEEQLKDVLSAPREAVFQQKDRDVDDVIVLPVAVRPSAAEPAPAPAMSAGRRVFGAVSVTSLVTNFKKIKFESHENVGYGEVHLPAQEMQTEAYWVAFEDWVQAWLEENRLDFGAGLRGLATLLKAVIPLYVLCDRNDLRTAPMVRSPHVERPTVFVYDFYPGGIGISRKVYEQHAEIWAACQGLIHECACARGCPSCVGPGLEVGPLGKSSAAQLLRLGGTNLV